MPSPLEVLAEDGCSRSLSPSSEAWVKAVGKGKPKPVRQGGPP